MSKYLYDCLEHDNESLSCDKCGRINWHNLKDSFIQRYASVYAYIDEEKRLLNLEGGSKW